MHKEADLQCPSPSILFVSLFIPFSFTSVFDYRRIMRFVNNKKGCSVIGGGGHFSSNEDDKR
jgi:hypothetical protein